MRSPQVPEPSWRYSGDYPSRTSYDLRTTPIPVQLQRQYGPVPVHHGLDAVSVSSVPYHEMLGHPAARSPKVKAHLTIRALKPINLRRTLHFLARLRWAARNAPEQDHDKEPPPIVTVGEVRGVVATIARRTPRARIDAAENERELAQRRAGAQIPLLRGTSWAVFASAARGKTRSTFVSYLETNICAS